MYDVSVGPDIWTRHKNQLRPRHLSEPPPSHSSLPFDILLDTFELKAATPDETQPAAQDASAKSFTKKMDGSPSTPNHPYSNGSQKGPLLTFFLKGRSGGARVIPGDSCARSHQGHVLRKRGSVMYDVSVGPDIWTRHKNQLRPRHLSEPPPSHSSLPFDILLDTFELKAATPDETQPAAQDASAKSFTKKMDGSPSTPNHPYSNGSQKGPLLTFFLKGSSTWNRLRVSLLGSPTDVHFISRGDDFFNLLRPLLSLNFINAVNDLLLLTVTLILGTNTDVFDWPYFCFFFIENLYVSIDNHTAQARTIFEKLIGVGTNQDEMLVTIDVSSLFSSACLKFVKTAGTGISDYPGGELDVHTIIFAETCKNRGRIIHVGKKNVGTYLPDNGGQHLTRLNAQMKKRRQASLEYYSKPGAHALAVNTEHYAKFGETPSPLIKLMGLTVCSERKQRIRLRWPQ
ncbi:gap-Pol polyprotein [Clonorchis sinensis]|uniref:Gap-Pol polyprotein n=1 Tax=Clonorchis sinensis TaxID=79923 RepID=G7YTL4_CLOSI|nr:gap-Pol polyprotein [Clonorchis sinensis]